MKKLMIIAGMAFAATTAMAQSADSYIVKTKGVTKTEAKVVKENSDKEEEPTGKDFVSQNFRFYSLCDWKDGMKFMVLPEKYDLLVNTFRDAGTGKEVPSGKLRQKIMVYNDHTVGANGRSRMNFTCQDDNKRYYFELPNGEFEDYCYNKLGVPTLAYLGDVDIAREKLMGQTLVTQATDYRKDVDYESDSYEEVKVEKGMAVKVVAVGVGTRSFPVKIIVADKDGNEFYQNVAISKTNSGMRDDEFIVDNVKFTFYGSFALATEEVKVSGDYAQYMNKTIYTKYATSMNATGGSDNRSVKIAKLTTFRIDAMTPVQNSNYVTLALTELETGRTYAKKVTFTNESVIGDIDGQKEDYFDYLFGIGDAPLKGSSKANQNNIRQGRVVMGMTEEEVKMAVGDPDKIIDTVEGRYQWVYTDSKLIVTFGKNGNVVGTTGARNNRNTTATRGNNRSNNRNNGRNR